MTPDLRVEGTGPVRQIVLDRPERRNAQTVSMWRELDRVAGDLAAARDEVRCVVLSGAGGYFSSGLDLAELQAGGALAALADPAGDREEALQLLAEVQHVFGWPSRAPFIVIAAVEGAAIGAGLELALACDVRIVADTARLRLPEVAMGGVPDLGGCHRLRSLVGAERALDLIACSRWVDGRDAVALGIGLRSAPAGEVARAALDYAAELAAAPRVNLSQLKAALSASSPETSLAAAAVGMVDGLRARARSA